MDLFNRYGLYSVLFRYGHVLSGIAWIGLLYYFNFVQVPAFAQMEAPARTDAIRKLAVKALWWFRWAAMATVAFGVLIIATVEEQGDYWKRPQGNALLAGIIMALVMFYNVWMVIWPNQRIVIANAERVAAGQEADPAAAPAGRKALLASRTNTLLSITMLFFMIVAGHANYTGGQPGGGARFAWLIITVVIVGALEANALGLIQGTGPGPTKKMLETHKDTLIAGGALLVLFIILNAIVLG
jgi:uncharacterized membrane protein